MGAGRVGVYALRVDIMSAPGADPLAAIRQRHARYAATSDATGFVTQGHADMDAILKQWDTHQSALRALVAQWKQEAVIADATCNDTIAVQLHECADAVERLLESEP